MCRYVRSSDIKNEEGDPIGERHDDDDEREEDSLVCREKIGVATSRVVQEEAAGFVQTRGRRADASDDPTKRSRRRITRMSKTSHNDTRRN